MTLWTAVVHALSTIQADTPSVGLAVTGGAMLGSWSVSVNTGSVILTRMTWPWISPGSGSMVVMGAVERKHMSLVGNLREYRRQRNRFEIERILDGIHAVGARNMREIREERNAIVRDTLPAPKWNLKLGVIDWAWVTRFMFEQRVLNLLR